MTNGVPHPLHQNEETFHGQPTQTLANSHLRVDYLTEVGARLVRLFVGDSPLNLMAELPDLQFESPYGTYQLWGGHRLWVAPESRKITYVPDDQKLEIVSTSDGVDLHKPTESVTGLAKTISLQLHPDRPALTVTHQIRNDGLWDVELAPWAITQLPLGGYAVLPQPVGNVDADGLLSNRALTLWPYTRWHDARLDLHDEMIVVDAHKLAGPACKIGYTNVHGWAGYFYHDLFFCKRFHKPYNETYPDNNSNVEIYVNEHFLELETLAPLAQLAPGETATHTETWEFYTGFGKVDSAEKARTIASQLIH